MASPCLSGDGLGGGRLPRTPVAEFLRVASLALVAFVALGASWAFASQAAADAADRDASVSGRAAPVARALSVDDGMPATVEVDGQRSAVRASTVIEALRKLGVSVGPGDRVSPPLGAAVVPGLRILVDRGVPLTLVDAGRATALRVPRGATVAQALAASGVDLGPLDRIEQDLAARVGPGEVLRVVRVADHEATAREAVGYDVQAIRDPDLGAGRFMVLSRGVPGLAENTYLIRIQDGTEVGRTLLSTRELVAPVAEVRRVGTKPPPPPSEIEAIIRDAAARWGADPDQMLRVAWCESRFNPSAYHPGSGASGLFQFLPSTWAANSVRTGYAGASPFDADANANVAAFMFARGQSASWVCK